MESIFVPLLIFIPIIGSLIIMSPVFSDNERQIRHTAKLFALLHFVISVFSLIFFNNEYTFQLNGFNIFGISSSFRIDILSMLLIVLTSFIFVISIFFSKETIKKSQKLYYSLILFLETSIVGIFSASDMILFFLFWELELIPMYLLILKWGSANREKTALKFILYTFFGSIFILAGILLLYVFNYLYTNTLTMDMFAINTYLMDEPVKNIIFLLFFIGFGVKIPIIPFHNWLSDTHSQAPSPVSIILSAILLKIGAYGFIRFNFTLLNETFEKFALIVMTFALINIIYSAFCAIHQKDLKRIIAYSGISHMGIFLLGLCALNEAGTMGAIFQLFSHALITAGLFTIAGIIYHKCGTKNIIRLKGTGSKMPKLMMISIPVILGAMAVPLTSGFIAEFLCFMGAFLNISDTAKIITAIAILSMIFSSVYILKIFHGIFFGELHKKYYKLKDINSNSFAILLTLAGYIIFFGIFPFIIFNAIQGGF